MSQVAVSLFSGAMGLDLADAGTPAGRPPAE
jgi:hypothetical protein